MNTPENVKMISKIVLNTNPSNVCNPLLMTLGSTIAQIDLLLANPDLTDNQYFDLVVRRRQVKLAALAFHVDLDE